MASQERKTYEDLSIIHISAWRRRSCFLSIPGIQSDRGTHGSSAGPIGPCVWRAIYAAGGSLARVERRGRYPGSAPPAEGRRRGRVATGLPDSDPGQGRPDVSVWGGH